MGNNAEIRQRMDTYRSILLAINWIGSIIGVIAGFVLMEQIEGYAFFIIIIAVFLGIIGHFLINVALAIPFILLNNGDILESMKNNFMGNGIEDTKEFTASHIVTTMKDEENIGLRNEPKIKNEPFIEIPNGTEVQFLSSGNYITINKLYAPWVQIRTKENICGWCFMGYLKKL